MKTRRIVVGLDIAPQSRWALAAAAALASELDAELEALFVESDELHHLAGLPFARETGTASAQLRRLDRGALERSLQARAQEARRALTELAAPLSVRWSFRVARGSVPEQVLAASSGEDISVLALARLGPEALAMGGEAPVTLLVLPKGARLHGPLAAVCSVDVAPSRAAALLVPLARAIGDGLAILVQSADIERAGRWCVEAAELLKREGRRADLEIVREDQDEALQAALERLAPRAVAIVSPAPAARP